MLTTNCCIFRQNCLHCGLLGKVRFRDMMKEVFLSTFQKWSDFSRVMLILKKYYCKKSPVLVLGHLGVSGEKVFETLMFLTFSADHVFDVLNFFLRQYPWCSLCLNWKLFAQVPRHSQQLCQLHYLLSGKEAKYLFYKNRPFCAMYCWHFCNAGL